VAAGHGKLDAVRLLLKELGADARLLHNGYTASYVAAQYGHEHVVRCLVKEFGADVNIPTINADVNTPKRKASTMRSSCG
jgi:ankyrin repeat protein